VAVSNRGLDAPATQNAATYVSFNQEKQGREHVGSGDEAENVNTIRLRNLKRLRFAHEAKARSVAADLSQSATLNRHACLEFQRHEQWLQ